MSSRQLPEQWKRVGTDEVGACGSDQVGVHGRAPLLKRLLDLALAAIGLVVLSPLLAVVAVAIKLDSPGPILFTQVRVGQEGRLFRLYKFRTMKIGQSKPVVPEEIDFATFVFTPPVEDPRVTRIGRLLRSTSIDELPQLVNVVKGEMSLVGPRPEIPEVVSRYPPLFHERHSVKPGITGLAQVSGRSDLTYLQTMMYDVRYAREHSVCGDLVILAKTVGVVLSRKGAR